MKSKAACEDAQHCLNPDPAPHWTLALSERVQMLAEVNARRTLDVPRQVMLSCAMEPHTTGWCMQVLAEVNAGQTLDVPRQVMLSCAVEPHTTGWCMQVLAEVNARQALDVPRQVMLSLVLHKVVVPEQVSPTPQRTGSPAAA